MIRSACTVCGENTHSQNRLFCFSLNFSCILHSTRRDGVGCLREQVAARRECESRALMAGSCLVVGAQGGCRFHDKRAIAPAIICDIITRILAVATEHLLSRAFSESAPFRHEQPPRCCFGNGGWMRMSVSLCASHASAVPNVTRNHFFVDLFVVVNPSQTGDRIDAFIVPEGIRINLITIVEGVNEGRRRRRRRRRCGLRASHIGVSPSIIRYTRTPRHTHQSALLLFSIWKSLHHFRHGLMKPC